MPEFIFSSPSVLFSSVNTCIFRLCIPEGRARRAERRVGIVHAALRRVGLLQEVWAAAERLRAERKGEQHGTIKSDVDNDDREEERRE